MTTAPRSPLVEVERLAVALPTGPEDSVQALRGVSLTVSEGQRVGIVGESGSGKSITGRSIAGLLPESPRVRVDGSLRVAGEELVGAPDTRWREVRRRRVSMIFQDPLSFLNPTMRVGAQVAEACRSGSKVAGYLQLAGLSRPAEVALRYPFELSGGMRQRVMIAMAMAKRPDLIVADEPTTALDVTVQAHVLESLDRSVRELGTALVMISHDLAVVAKMCDYVYVMYDGEIVEHGRTQQVFRAPAEAYTQSLLRGARRLNATAPNAGRVPLCG